MKSILIVVEYFAPINEVAAIRATKLAKYFKLRGCNIGVISRKLRFNESIDTTLQKNLKYVDEHIVVHESWLIQKIFGIYSKLRNSKVRKEVTNLKINKSKKHSILGILFFISKMLFSESLLFYAKKAYSKRAKKHIRKMCQRYDVILTSSGPFSVNVLGRFAKRRNPNILWIADFRDPLIMDFPNKKHFSYYQWLQNEVIEKADVITGVSDACTENFKDGFKGNVVTIYNGFDDNDIVNIDAISSDKFVLTYAGTLYNGKRDLSIIFRVLSELIKELKMNRNNIIVNYMGNDVSPFLEQANGYDMQGVCQTFGKVSREKSLQLQLSSHILLLASWNNTGDTGVITGKFLEYMMINRPIVCSVMGNLPDSALKEMIYTANNGVVWEQANDEMDYPNIKEYILKQYMQYEQGLPLCFSPDVEYINQFRYDRIANKFIELIENTY